MRLPLASLLFAAALLGGCALVDALGDGGDFDGPGDGPDGDSDGGGGGDGDGDGDADACSQIVDLGFVDSVTPTMGLGNCDPSTELFVSCAVGPGVVFSFVVGERAEYEICAQTGSVHPVVISDDARCVASPAGSCTDSNCTLHVLDPGTHLIYWVAEIPAFCSDVGFSVSPTLGPVVDAGVSGAATPAVR